MKKVIMLLIVIGLCFCYVTLFAQDGCIYIVGPWVTSMQGIAILAFLVPLAIGVFVSILIIIIKKRKSCQNKGGEIS